MESNEMKWTGRRIRMKHKYARDYCEPIFTRYMRRFGYISRERALVFVAKIAGRWDWQSNARLHVTYDHKKYPVRSSGRFCGVFLETIERCVYCGSSGYIGHSLVRKKDDLIDHRDIRESDPMYFHNPWSPDGLGFHCHSKICNEVKRFLFNGEHSLADAAKSIKVPLKRPTKKFISANSNEEKFILACSAMLDFEARYKQRIENIEQTRCNKIVQTKENPRFLGRGLPIPRGMG